MTAMDDPIAWARSHEADPVRLRVLQGLARRAAAQPPGALRERLVARLLQRAAEPALAAPVTRSACVPSPLTELVAELQATPELRNVQAHHRTWSALRLGRRMAEVSAPVPEHLGPLNNQVLVTRALQQLRDLAPAYLHRLLTQLDTLAALTPLQPAETPPSGATKRSSRRR